MRQVLGSIMLAQAFDPEARPVTTPCPHISEQHSGMGKNTTNTMLTISRRASRHRISPDAKVLLALIQAMAAIDAPRGRPDHPLSMHAGATSQSKTYRYILWLHYDTVSLLRLALLLRILLCFLPHCFESFLLFAFGRLLTPPGLHLMRLFIFLPL